MANLMAINVAYTLANRVASSAAYASAACAMALSVARQVACAMREQLALADDLSGQSVYHLLFPTFNIDLVAKADFVATIARSEHPRSSERRGHRGPTVGRAGPSQRRSSTSRRIRR